MSCSQKKVQKGDLIPAMERYDGPAFRVIRKYLNDVGDPYLAVYVLSAQFGVISARRRIANYDRKMNAQRARFLRRPAVRRIKSILRNRKYRQAFFIGSQNYLCAIEPLDQFEPCFAEAKGKPGQKLRSLHDWLRS